MIASELMTRPVFTVRPDTSLADVARTLLEHRIGCLPVVTEAGKICGIVTETDFAAKERGVPFSLLILPQVFGSAMPPEAIERVRREARTTPAREIMITAVVTAGEDTPVEELARQMLRYDIDHIPVVRNGAPVGIVSRHDFLRKIVDAPSPA